MTPSVGGRFRPVLTINTFNTQGNSAPLKMFSSNNVRVPTSPITARGYVPTSPQHQPYIPTSAPIPATLNQVVDLTAAPPTTPQQPITSTLVPPGAPKRVPKRPIQLLFPGYVPDAPIHPMATRKKFKAAMVEDSKRARVKTALDAVDFQDLFRLEGWIMWGIVEVMVDAVDYFLRPDTPVPMENFATGYLKPRIQGLLQNEELEDALDFLSNIVCDIVSDIVMN